MHADVNGIGLSSAALGDDDVAALWAASGAAWLTDPAIGVPGGLVRRIVGLVDELDRRGAALAGLVEARGLGLLAERAAVMRLPPSGRTSAGGAARFLRALDGWLVLSLARSDDLDMVPAWLDGDVGPRPTGSVSDPVSDPMSDTVSEDDWTAVERAVAGRTVGELVERSTLLGLACSAVGEVSDARPVLIERLGDAAPRPLEGAVVVNLASLWAGPLCADVLSRLGARSITVESTGRPDGGRRVRRFFEALHGHSESVALDLTEANGRRLLTDLLRHADVVIEGSRPRALEQMGIDARQAVADGVSVWVSITSHGRGPSARDRVGFGDDAAGAGGLVGWSGDEPRFVADAVGDPLAGLTAASVAASLLERRGSWLADVALARVAASAAGGWVAGAGSDVARPRPRRDPGAPMPLGRDNEAVLGGFGIG